jgi:hypothetical protein
VRKEGWERRRVRWRVVIVYRTLSLGERRGEDEG